MEWIEIVRSDEFSGIFHILHRLEKRNHVEYVVHTGREILNCDLEKTTDLYSGDYFTDFLYAVEEYNRRCKRDHLDTTQRKQKWNYYHDPSKETEEDYREEPEEYEIPDPDQARFQDMEDDDPGMDLEDLEGYELKHDPCDPGLWDGMPEEEFFHEGD